MRVKTAALRKFYGYLEDRELLPGTNPAARLSLPKRRRRPNDWLRSDEDAKVLRACVTSSRTTAEDVEWVVQEMSRLTRA